MSHPELKRGLTLNELAEIVNANATKKGFYESVAGTLRAVDADAHEAVKIGLIAGEAHELMKEFQNRRDENLGEEAADIFIRLADYCAFKDIDLEAEVLRKIRINADRPRMHGGKRF